jgi:hypothetical protein
MRCQSVVDELVKTRKLRNNNFYRFALVQALAYSNCFYYLKGAVRVQ